MEYLLIHGQLPLFAQFLLTSLFYQITVHPRGPNHEVHCHLDLVGELSFDRRE